MRWLITLVLMCASAMAQTVTYYNQGLLRQPSAERDRIYLGILDASFTTNGIYATNGFWYIATNNGIAGALGQSTSLNSWASLSGFDTGASGDSLFVPATVANDTYYRITNYNYGVTNQCRFVLTKTNGIIQVDQSGWYKVDFSVSAQGAIGNEIEADVTTNSVPTDVAAAHGSTGTGTARNTTIAGGSRFYLTNGSTVSLSIKNHDGTTLLITHVQLNVGPP